MNTRFDTPDIILYNGTVFTVDETDSICEALAVCGNEILATGDSSEILGLAAPWTKLIDLKGRSAMPGMRTAVVWAEILGKPRALKGRR